MSRRVSAIIPSLDDDAQLAGLLSSLKGQGAEVIVDSTPGAIEATNAGAKSSKGDILLFLASDVRLRPGTIEAIKARFADEGLVGLTGFPIPYDGSLVCRIEYGFYYLLASLLSPVRFVTSGSFLAVRRSAFDAVGGFPDTYNNDGQMGAALRRLGRTKFDRSLAYYVSARRYNRLGFFRFNRQFLYTLENFIPVPAWWGRLGAALQKEHHLS